MRDLGQVFLEGGGCDSDMRISVLGCWVVRVEEVLRVGLMGEQIRVFYFNVSVGLLL